MSPQVPQGCCVTRWSSPAVLRVCGREPWQWTRPGRVHNKCSMPAKHSMHLTPDCACMHCTSVGKQSCCAHILPPLARHHILTPTQLTGSLPARLPLCRVCRVMGSEKIVEPSSGLLVCPISGTCSARFLTCAEEEEEEGDREHREEEFGGERGECWWS